MYEPEASPIQEPIDTLPVDVVKAFAANESTIIAQSLLPWGEHCTECNWPSCYTTCDLYTPREDGGCRLFVEGMVRLDLAEAQTPYLLKIRFKQWGKLWAPGSLTLYSKKIAQIAERANILGGTLTRSVPLPQSIRAKILGKIGSLRRRFALSTGPSQKKPDCFLLECYNPGPRKESLTLTIRSREANGHLYNLDQEVGCYQKLIEISPGFLRNRTPLKEISERVDLSRPFNIDLVPNQAEDTLLYFGLIDFVKERNPKTSSKKWKCVTWDLDNTLWDGILVEDGPKNLRIKPGVVDVIRDLDEKGILHSIASKNNFDEAFEVLRANDLDEFFLHPQINWKPKSQSIARIAQLLNIGLDSIAFVDDQEFEREEVRTAFPEVTTIDAVEYESIPERNECSVPVTDESKRRRQMYREQEKRNRVLETFQGDYERFLSDCNLKLKLEDLNERNLQRVYELAQRTNQMNFSGNRYPTSELRKLMRSNEHQTYVMHCSDKFGNYGIVGFAVVSVSEPRLLDLMFSCRIQGKRVEHSVLAFLLKQFRQKGSQRFYANYRQTERNKRSGQVFEDLGFVRESTEGDVASLLFELCQPVRDEQIVEISERSRSESVPPVK